MRTTINLDEQLLNEAQRLTGMKERTALIHEGLRALIERESARRFAFIPNGAKSLGKMETGGRALGFVRVRTGSELNHEVSARAPEETARNSRALW
jgi:hypothetical protein